MSIVLLRVDLGDVDSALRRANYSWAAAAVAMYTVSKLIAAARWRLYLTNVGNPPIVGLMGAYVIGTFLNTILPLRAGDFAKVQIVASRYALPRSGLTSSVFVVEAVLDVVTLLGLLLLGLAFLNLSFIPALFLWPFVFLSGGVFVAAVIISVLFPREMPDWQMPRMIPAPVRDGLRGAWPGFLEGMVVLRRSNLILRALSLHVLEWLMRAAVLYLFSLSFNLDAAPSTYLVLTVAISVFTFFPITFMNIGTYQVVTTEILGAAGVPRSEALAYSVTAQALSHAWVVLMGLVAVWSMPLWPGQASSVEPER
jgi:uncharacterized membrane protein YbhN (UPF0104 family)